jgi:hypothetical protein
MRTFGWLDTNEQTRSTSGAGVYVSGQPWRFLAPLFFLLCLLVPSLSTWAQNSSPNELVVILVDGLRFEDLDDQELSALKHMALHGSLGLLNCAVSGTRSSSNAVFTIAAGTQSPADDVASQAFNDWETPYKDNGSARMAYMRRMGPLDPDAQKRLPDPETAVKHLGFAVLERRGLNRYLLGPALAAAGITRWVGGCADTDRPDRTAALLTVDASGQGAGMFSLIRHDNGAAYGKLDDPLAMAQAVEESLESHRMCVVQAGDLSRLDSARTYLSDTQFHQRCAAALSRLNILVYSLTQLAAARPQLNVLLVSPHPPADIRHGGAWNQLTPVLGIGPSFPEGLMTSDTTRRVGLISNTDIAPTILALFHVSDVPPTFTGRAVSIKQGLSADERLASVARVDFISHLNEAAKYTVLIPMAVFYFFSVTAAIVMCRKAPASAHWLTPILISALNIPAAMLLAPVLAPPTLVEYTLRILAWAGGLTILCYLAALARKASPAWDAMALTLLLITVDTVTGQNLQKDALFSSYTIAGIRYYGLGNEYLGVVLPFALFLVFQRIDENFAPGRRLLLSAIGMWILLALMCGWPSFGANAGSLIVLTTAFGAGALQLTRRKLTVPVFLLLVAIGFALAFGFGALDARMNGVHSSHSGTVLQAASHGRGAGYLYEIAMRKIQLNVGYLMTTSALLAVLAVTLSAVTAYCFARKQLHESLSRRPAMVGAIHSLLPGCLAALLFKDSGIVTILFSLGALVVLTVDAMINDAAVRAEEPTANH